MGQGGGLVLVLVATRSIEFREARWSHPNQDKHKAPSSTPPRPLSLQDAGRTFLDSLVTHHQDAGDASVPLVQLPDSLVKHHQVCRGICLKPI